MNFGVPGVPDTTLKEIDDYDKEQRVKAKGCGKQIYDKGIPKECGYKDFICTDCLKKALKEQKKYYEKEIKSWEISQEVLLNKTEMGAVLKHKNKQFKDIFKRLEAKRVTDNDEFITIPIKDWEEIKEENK